MRWLSSDGQYRVTIICPDGLPAYRIEMLGDRGRTWYWLDNVLTPEGVARYVDLALLEECPLPGAERADLAPETAGHG